MHSRGFIPVIFLIGVLVILAAAFFYLIDPLQRFQKEEAKRSPIPITIQTPPLSSKPEDKSVFKEVNGILDFDKEYFTGFDKVAHDSLSTMTCLTDPTRPGDVNNQTLNSYVEQIQNYKFSDEVRIINSDGQVVIENEGQRSVRDITFTSICKSINKYFFIFDSMSDKVHVGGGGSAPTHIAYTDNGRLIINENPAITINTINFPDKFEGGIAYFGCRVMYGLSESSAYYGCGGGDGPASAGGIYKLDVVSGKITELAYCQNGIAKKQNAFEIICADSQSNIYYHNLKSY